MINVNVTYLPSAVQRCVSAAATSDWRQPAAVPGTYHQTVHVVAVAQLVGRASPVPSSCCGRLLVQPFQFPYKVGLELVGRTEGRPAHGTATRRGRGHQLLTAGRGLLLLLLLLLLLDRRPVVVIVAVVVVVVDGARRRGGRRGATPVGRRRRRRYRCHRRRQFFPCGTPKNVVKIEIRCPGRSGRHYPQLLRLRLRLLRLLLSSASEIGHRAADTDGD